MTVCRHMYDLKQTGGQPQRPYGCFAPAMLVIRLNAKGAAP
jgi:hypothetical protein